MRRRRGEQRLAVLWLKLAELEYIYSVTGERPLLLLDDIFDKFDASRVSKIINLVASDNFGQIFITDTSQERMGEILDQMEGNYKLFYIDENGITNE